jgi:hypothetical protein
MTAEPSRHGRPRGSTGAHRARRRAGCEARRVARGPLPFPID